MDDTILQPIECLQADWDARRGSPASVAALRRLAATEATIAGLDADDLYDVVAWLRGARGGPTAAAAEVVRAMLRSAGVDPLVPRAILQAIVPGLVGVARRLGWGRGGEWETPSAFFADLLTTAWEVIADWSGDDRPYALLDLLSAARCRMRRQLLRDVAHRRRTVVGLDPVAVRPDPWREGPTDLEELARALEDLSEHQEHRADAAVLYAHRVLGYSITELARRTGRSRRHLGERRDRAARLLTA